MSSHLRSEATIFASAASHVPLPGLILGSSWAHHLDEPFSTTLLYVIYMVFDLFLLFVFLPAEFLDVAYSATSIACHFFHPAFPFDMGSLAASAQIGGFGAAGGGVGVRILGSRILLGLGVMPFLLFGVICSGDILV